MASTTPRQSTSPSPGGVLSVEHEDPVWGGTEGKVKAAWRSPSGPSGP
jgi:hypothetical protein